jgi:hypothetical protein
MQPVLPLRIAGCRKPHQQRDERGQTKLAHRWCIPVRKCAIREAQLWRGELSIDRVLYISYFFNDPGEIKAKYRRTHLKETLYVEQYNLLYECWLCHARTLVLSRRSRTQLRSEYRQNGRVRRLVNLVRTEDTKG